MIIGTEGIESVYGNNAEGWMMSADGKTRFLVMPTHSRFALSGETIALRKLLPMSGNSLKMSSYIISGQPAIGVLEFSISQEA